MKTVHSFLSSDVAAEVDGCGSVTYLVGQYGKQGLYAGRPEATAAVPVLAECETTSVPEEQFMLQCSTHAVASEYYRLELHTRQRCGLSLIHI